MRSKERQTLRGLLKEKVTIPAIQRDYAFGRTDSNSSQKRVNFVSKLVEIIQADPERELKMHLDFIYGKEVGKSFIPLDGQQRITTLWLLNVYLAKMSGNKKYDFLNNFTYATRTSTRDFCDYLVHEKWDLTETGLHEETVVEYFQKQKWFFNSWRYDPTISGMLVMLQEIHKQLSDSQANSYYKNLDNITFSFLDVDELGQPEDLYVKMNSRGKQLSDWDNFKAELFELPVSEDFKKWIDTKYLDYFWNLGSDGEDKAKNTESRMLRFFLLNLFMKRITSPDSAEKNAEGISNYVRNHWKEMVDFDFLNSIQSFIQVLEKYSSEIKNYNSPRFSAIRFNELLDILRIPTIDGYTANLDLYFAYWTYFNSIKGKTFDIKELFDVVRISTNIEETYRKEVEITRISLKAFYEAMTWPKGILDYFANQDLTEVTFGASSEEQKNEEIIKARLLLENDGEKWAHALYSAENNKYFRGTVGWILRLSDGNLTIFQQYVDWIFDKFDDEAGLEDKTEIADMLKYTDDLMIKGRFFPKNNADVKGSYRDWSWKRFFRERGYKDSPENEISIDWIKNWYEHSNVEVSKLPVWRQWLIRYPKVLNEIGAIAVWGDNIIGLPWWIRVFSSNKYNIPVTVAKEYIGGFQYWGNMDSSQSSVDLTEKNLKLSFDGSTAEFLISNVDDQLLEKVSANNIESAIDDLRAALNKYPNN